MLFLEGLNKGIPDPLLFLLPLWCAGVYRIRARDHEFTNGPVLVPFSLPVLLGDIPGVVDQATPLLDRLEVAKLDTSDPRLAHWAHGRDEDVQVGARSSQEVFQEGLAPLNLHWDA